MSKPSEDVVEVVLNGVHLWIYADDLECGCGALMPTPTHVQDTFGFGESYAHLYPNGISRFGQKIGDRSDLEIVPE